MKIKIELAAGPLWVEIEADGEEDYVAAVEDVLKIIENRDFDVEETVSDTDSEPLIQPTLEESTEGHPGGSTDESTSVLSDLSTRTDVPIDKLEQIFYIDADLEDDPYLLIDPEDVFGSTKAAQQGGAMKVLLLVWDYVYDEEPVNTSRLQDAVTKSNVDTKKIRDQYDEDVHTSGYGRGVEIELTRPGELTAVELVQEMAEVVD